MDAPSAPVRRRRWLSFSLRALLLATTIFGVWLGFKVAAARRQHAIVAAILSHGGVVLYDYQRLTAGGLTGFNKDADFPVPNWLRSLAGDDFFITPREILLDDNRVDDEFVEKHIAPLRGLTGLRLKNANITGAGLKTIGRFEDLEWLGVTGANLTADDLAPLSSLKVLKAIWIFRNLQGEQIQNTLQDHTNLECIETPLVEAVRYLGDKHHVKIQIEAPEEDAKLQLYLTLDVKNKTLRDTLSDVLAASKLNYVVRANEAGIVLTSPAVARQNWPGFEKLNQMFPNAMELQADW